MTAIVIILILLGILLLTPFGVRVKYGDREELYLSLRFGFINKTLFPKKKGKKKKPKKEKPPGKKKEKKKPAAAQGHDKKKSGKKHGLSFYLQLAKNALKASAVFFRGIAIDNFEASVVVADQDAAKAAINYGRICGLAGYLKALTAHCRRVKNFNVETGLNFFEDKIKFAVDAQLSFLLYSLFGMAFCFAYEYIKMTINEKKRRR